MEMIRQLLQVKLWWLSDFFVFIETTLMVGVLKMTKNDRKMVVFLRDSLLVRIIMSYQIDYEYFFIDERSLLEWIHK